ncbi:ketopantoate reductase family protein [Tepidibacillus fermentans]|uniref:2-dehydropantoate 2-reductase n=1 Tax=Tepidibacillus fermentans TaxID=1281767 RepID=A0A4R3KL17_9BACI|nr:2-dehydropantoate 2-reductase [Tepidibacillus fermentans]TCS84427.1 2-dehydropantoate 2-reductase [Tepidibacillus fermentans]
MKIAIIGAGSLGLLFASRFIIHSDENIYLITKTEEQKRLIQKEKLYLQEIDGTNYSLNVKVYSQFDHGQTVDWIFLTVKQTNIAGIETTIKKWSDKHTKVICFQNGMGHFEYLKQKISNPVYLAVTTEGALRKAGNHIRHTGKGEIWLGRLEEQTDGSIEDLLSLLDQAGFRAFYSEKIKEKIWHKLVINAVINPLTALFEVKNGELIEDPYLKTLSNQLLSEIIRVLRKAEVPIDENIANAIEQVCIQTKDNESSMLQDLRRGQMTEIDSILKPIIDLGIRNHLTTTLLESIRLMVHAKENQLAKRKW